MPRAKKKTPTNAKGATAKATAKMVAVWEDDPGDPKLPPREPITVQAPNQAAKPYPFKIAGATPTPAVYKPGTAQFRFYSNAAALRRTADFWGQIVAAGTKWEVGATLPVHLDDGVDLNAF